MRQQLAQRLQVLNQKSESLRNKINQHIILIKLELLCLLTIYTIVSIAYRVYRLNYIYTTFLYLLIQINAASGA